MPVVAITGAFIGMVMAIETIQQFRILGQEQRIGQVIGLTVVAIGTSLPELATGIMSAARRHSDIMIGNIVGSNIFNILFILGVTSILQPVHVDPRFGFFDVPVLLAFTIGFALLLFSKLGVNRLTAGSMLAAYGTYTVFLVQV